MQALIHYLNQTKQFTSQQIDSIRSKIILRTCKKGDHLCEPGKPPTELAFILQGIVRVFAFAGEGQETTLYFIDENNFAIDVNDRVEAVMKTDLAILSLQALPAPHFTIADWFRLTEYILARSLIDKAERISPNLSGDATARYRKFMEKYPQIAGRIPLGYLASYLGITQQSLSRIRKQMTKKSSSREE